MFCLIPHLLSTQTTKSWKNVMNNKFKAQSLNRKSFRKFTWRALNMSGYVDQSARSIEGRCVVNSSPNISIIHIQTLRMLVLYSFKGLGQHWFRYWFIPWRYSGITWINVVLKSMVTETHLRTITQAVHKISIYKMDLVHTLVILLPNVRDQYI